MGFTCASIRMPNPITITVLFNLLYCIKFMAVTALNCLGLFKPPEEDYWADDVLEIERPSPSLVQLLPHTYMASIKKRLPVVEYCDFLDRLGIQEDEDTVCVVCLNGFRRQHEIRELSNCCHMFHRECLDSWVDAGQLTCPLCRSMLFPGKCEKTRSANDPWMMERDAYLFGDNDYVVETTIADHSQAIM